MSIVVHLSEVILCTEESLFCRLTVPFHRFHVGLFHAATALVHPSEIVLRNGISLLRRLAIPFHGLHVGLLEPKTTVVAHPQQTLGGTVAVQFGQPRDELLTAFRCQVVPTPVPGLYEDLGLHDAEAEVPVGEWFRNVVPANRDARIRLHAGNALQIERPAHRAADRLQPVPLPGERRDVVAGVDRLKRLTDRHRPPVQRPAHVPGIRATDDPRTRDARRLVHGVPHGPVRRADHEQRALLRRDDRGARAHEVHQFARRRRREVATKGDVNRTARRDVQRDGRLHLRHDAEGSRTRIHGNDGPLGNHHVPVRMVRELDHEAYVQPAQLRRRKFLHHALVAVVQRGLVLPRPGRGTAARRRAGGRLRRPALRIGGQLRDDPEHKARLGVERAALLGGGGLAVRPPPFAARLGGLRRLRLREPFTRDDAFVAAVEVMGHGQRVDTPGEDRRVEEPVARVASVRRRCPHDEKCRPNARLLVRIGQLCVVQDGVELLQGQPTRTFGRVVLVDEALRLGRRLQQRATGQRTHQRQSTQNNQPFHKLFLSI